MKRVIIHYPSVTQFFNFIEKKDYPNDSRLSLALNEFFESKDSDVVPIVDESDFNVLVFNTNTKQITGDVKRILDEYQSRVGDIKRNIKIYSIDYIYPIDVIGYLPQITHMLPKLSMQNKFSLIICQYELLKSPLITHFKDYVNNRGLLIMDKNNSLNYDNIKGWNKITLLDSFYTFEPIISSREPPEYQIYDSDLTISQMLSYNTPDNHDRMELNDYLSGFIRTYFQHKIVEVRLNRKVTNVLVMCTDEFSIKINKCISILRKCIGDDYDYEMFEFYHIGKNILIEEYSYVTRCLINNLKILSNTKFDIIISDGCPVMNINSNIDHISELLKGGQEHGALILLKTNRQIPSYVNIEIKSDEYSMFIKE